MYDIASIALLSATVGMGCFAVGFLTGSKKGADVIDELERVKEQLAKFRNPNMPRAKDGKFVRRVDATAEQLRRELAGAV